MNIAVSDVVVETKFTVVRSIEKVKNCFDGVLQILSFAFYSVTFLLVSWHEERWTFFSSMCESTFWFLQMVFKWRRLKEISVYHQHTVGVRGHALLWSGLCVRYGKVYNKCTMVHAIVHFVVVEKLLCQWKCIWKYPNKKYFSHVTQQSDSSVYCDSQDTKHMKQQYHS